MKIRKSTMGISFLAVGALLLAGCASSDQSGNSATEPGELKEMTIRVSTVLPTTSHTHQTLLEVAERVSDRTDGLLQLEIYPDAQLGTTVDTTQQAAAGDDLITYTDAAGLADIASGEAKDLDILAGPFLFENSVQAEKFHESELFDGMVETLAEDTGIRVLSLNYFLGERNIIGEAGYPDPADLSNVKVRTPPIEAWTRTFDLLNAVPTTVEYAETYSALQQGVVDAAEASVTGVRDQKWFEAVKHLTLTKHFSPFLGFAMNENVFQGLPVEFQTVLLEEFAEGGRQVTALEIGETDKVIKELEAAGVTVYEADTAAYQKQTKPFYDRYAPGLLEEIRAAGN